MPVKQRVLVTGASGFLGAHVVEHLLRARYAVRGTVRQSKADALRKAVSNSDFEVTVIEDLVAGDFSAALQDVNSVIHVASPVLNGTGTDFLEVAIQGTMNVLRQAHAAKVYKVTIVSSFASAFTNPQELADSARVLTDTDWNETTKEDVLKPGIPNLRVYAASKALAERAAWDFAESHPEVDLITILPPFIYGPLAPGHVVTESITTLSTDSWLYQLFARPTPTYPPPGLSHAVDVRDVAKATVLSLVAQRKASGQRRRILLWGGSFSWKQAVEHLEHVRPDLRVRLVDGGKPDSKQAKAFASLDTSKAKEVLGLTNFIGWKQMVEDAVDSMLEREHMWTKM